MKLSASTRQAANSHIRLHRAIPSSVPHAPMLLRTCPFAARDCYMRAGWEDLERTALYRRGLLQASLKLHSGNLVSMRFSIESQCSYN